MTHGLKRYYGNHDLHFITGSCYQRRALLLSPRNRDLFLDILEQTRGRYRGPPPSQLSHKLRPPFA
jgi:hypothetical protein